MKERRASLEKNLSGITGCDTDQLSMDDLVNVFEESWTGERVVTDERDERSLPLVTMSREYTETQADMRSPDQLDENELDQQIIDDLQQTAAPTETSSTAEPNADSEGTTDFSDEDHARRTVSDDALNDRESVESPEVESETEAEAEGETQAALSAETA